MNIYLKIKCTIKVNIHKAQHVQQEKKERNIACPYIYSFLKNKPRA